MTALEPQAEGIPLPRPTPISRPFWEGCAAGELRIQRCTRCGTAIFDPTLRCRSCGARDLEWEVASGRGAIISWSIVWRPQTPAFQVPYAAIIVRLEEGCAMVSNLIGCSTNDVETGMRVRVTFHRVGNGISLPYFRPDTSALSSKSL